jgi:DNA primase
MLLGKEFLDNLKNKADISALFQEFFGSGVKNVGSRGVTKCPFHEEKTPSCYLDSTRQTFNCFGCGAKGDAITLYMRHFGYSFMEAVKNLSIRVGVPLPVDEGENYAQHEKLMALNEKMQQIFELELQNAPKKVLEYLEGRGLTLESAKRYGLGLAPDSWDVIPERIRAAGINTKELSNLGILRVSGHGQPYCVFRNRLIFPIRDKQSRVIAFGGRLLPGDKPLGPKYLNSSESKIYQKSRAFYGIEVATNPQNRSKTAGELYIVEGYFDAITLWEAGIGNVVATCGTSFNKGHSDLLERLTKKIIFFYDGDEAGRKALWKTLPLVLPKKVLIHCVLTPQGEDPDSLGRKYRSDEIRNLPRKDLFFAYLDTFRNTFTGQNIGEKERAINEILQSLVSVPEGIKRDELLNAIAQHFDVDPMRLSESKAEFKDPTRVKQSSKVPLEASETFDRGLSEILVLILVLGKEGEALIETPRYFSIFPSGVQAFLSSFWEVLKTYEPATPGREESLRSLIKGASPEWREIWRRARILKRNFATLGPTEMKNLQKLKADCQRSLELRIFLERERQITESLALPLNDEERELLLQQKLALVREGASLR